MNTLSLSLSSDTFHSNSNFAGHLFRVSFLHSLSFTHFPSQNDKSFRKGNRACETVSQSLKRGIEQKQNRQKGSNKKTKLTHYRQDIESLPRKRRHSRKRKKLEEQRKEQQEQNKKNKKKEFQLSPQIRIVINHGHTSARAQARAKSVHSKFSLSAHYCVCGAHYCVYRAHYCVYGARKTVYRHISHAP